MDISINARIKIALILFAVVFLALLFLFPRDVKKEVGEIRIGAGKDITGVLLEEVVAEAEKVGMGDAFLTAYVFTDCCSSTAQWALQAEEIDMGFYCSSAAMAMVNKVDDFVLYAPIILNSEVVATLPETGPPTTIGIPKKRSFLGPLAEEYYPQITEVREIDRTYLSYSLKLEEVEGVVLDVADAAAAEEFVFSPLTDQPYISYCMVVRRDFLNTEVFQDFLKCYESTIERLNTTEEKVRLMGMEPAFWGMTGLEFLPVSED